MSKRPFTVIMAEDNEHDILATKRAWEKNRILNPLYIVKDGGIRELLRGSEDYQSFLGISVSSGGIL